MGRIANAVTADKKETKKAPAVKKLGRSGTVSGAAKPNNVVKLQNSSISGAHVKANSPMYKKGTDATLALGSLASTPRRVNHDSPIGNKDAMAEIIEGIQQADAAEPNNAKFLDLVVAMVKDGAGRFFGVSTYERLIRAALTSEQIKKRKPLFMGLAGALTREQALAAQVVAESAPVNAAQAQANADDFNAKVASGELPEGLHATTTTIEPIDICAKLVSAANRVPEGLLRFPMEDRERLAPFISFFERFWAVIPAYFKMEHSFVAKDFSALHRQPEFASLVSVGSYARFEFSCGSRAIVLRTLVGCATFFFAENEFISSLKVMKTALPEIIKEQMEKNKPTLSLMTGIPNGLMALVREFEQSPRLSLTSLMQIFGDPVNFLLKVPQTNLAHNVQQLSLLLGTAPAAV